MQLPDEFTLSGRERWRATNRSSSQPCRGDPLTCPLSQLITFELTYRGEDAGQEFAERAFDTAEVEHVEGNTAVLEFRDKAKYIGGASAKTIDCYHEENVAGVVAGVSEQVGHARALPGWLGAGHSLIGEDAVVPVGVEGIGLPIDSLIGSTHTLVSEDLPTAG